PGRQPPRRRRGVRVVLAQRLKLVGVADLGRLPLLLAVDPGRGGCRGRLRGGHLLRHRLLPSHLVRTSGSAAAPPGPPSRPRASAARACPCRTPPAAAGPAGISRSGATRTAAAVASSCATRPGLCPGPSPPPPARRPRRT